MGNLSVNTGPLVSTQWLADHLDDPDIRIVDASWYLPAQDRDGPAEYMQSHIPGAVFWDIDQIADTESGLPHTMPSAADFASHMEGLGIGSDNFVVIYDGMGLFSAARPWWMLHVFGHRNCALLDGGFPKWQSEGRPVTSENTLIGNATFTATENPSLMRCLPDMMSNVDSGREQVLDARAPGRFNGSEPEPRPNSRSGHIPGSFNLPFDFLLNPEDKTVLPVSELREKFTASGLNMDKPVVTSCGSGVTACILALGLQLLDKKDVAVYDGSWSEWGTRTDTPIEK